MKGMIFAAGLGTRFKPWTDHHPKALAIVNGKSLLQRNIEYLQHFGIREVVVNVHHFAGQIVDAIEIHKGWGSNVRISDESDEVLETGGGLKKASWFFDSNPFFVMNADILTNLDINRMKSFHENNAPLATLATTDRTSSRYFLFDDEDELCGWENSKTGERKISKQRSSLYPKAFSGIHIISPKIFSLVKREGKFSMVDVYLDLCKTSSIKSFDHSGSKLIDVGRAESMIEAEKLFD